MTARRAAWMYLALTGLVVAFHLALIVGLPWGHLTLGGRWQGVLPLAGRWVSAASIVVLAALAMALAMRAGLLRPRLPRWSIWVVVGYLVLGVVMHLISPSAAERMLWLPVITVQLACALRIARS